MDFLLIIAFVNSCFYLTNGQNDPDCETKCPIEGETVVCGFDMESTIYKMFPSTCALSAYTKCYKIEYVITPIEYCIKHHNKLVTSRREYGESCPVFCPSHYRPVCGASRIRAYLYKTFTNGCYMDLLNCRGEDEDFGYVEVPLSFCQQHPMKNIFKEQVVFTGMRDYRDYED